MIKISDNNKDWKYANIFLDTSALTKLLIPECNEVGTMALENYLKGENGIGIQKHTSEFCIGEVMGVLKRKWLSKKEIPSLTNDGYLIVVNRLIHKLENNRLVVHNISLSENSLRVGELVKKYGIDYFDALLLTFMEQNNHFCFVTADKALGKTAKDIGVKYWNILENCIPE